MGKWLERLRGIERHEKTAEPPIGGTDKTDKTPVSSVLAVTAGGGTREFMRLSAAPTATAKSIQTAPYRLAKADADAAHAVPWDDAACERFVARVAMFMLRGFNATDADDLAERLHLRDVDGDDRSSCIECRYLLPGPRCACEALGRQRVGRDDLAMLRRCPGFVARDREPAC